MRTASSIALLCLALVFASPAAPAAADDEVVVRDQTQSFPLAGAAWLHVEVPVGELHVAGADGARVEARLIVRCDEDARRCRSQAGDLRIESKAAAGGLGLHLEGYPERVRGEGPQVRLELRVPRRTELRAELGVGELEIAGLEGDVSAELGVGEARVRAPQSALRAVSVDVGVGEADLRPRPPRTASSRFLFLGNEIEWSDGPGEARLSVEVGVGEARVTLVP